MASNVESPFYWDGFRAGMQGRSWMTLKYEPGTRAFHQAMEGHADGLKARILQARGRV